MGSSANGDFFARTPDELKPILERYAEQARGVASQGVQLIVIPEHVGPITDASEAEAAALLGKIAKEAGTYVAIGIVGTHNFQCNLLLVFSVSANGAINCAHAAKGQFFEDFVRTNTLAG